MNFIKHRNIILLNILIEINKTVIEVRNIYISIDTWGQHGGPSQWCWWHAVCVGVDRLVVRLLGGGVPRTCCGKSRGCVFGPDFALLHTWCGLLSFSLMCLAVKLGHFGAAQQSTQGWHHGGRGRWDACVI